jgi:hypothetical protein
MVQALATDIPGFDGGEKDGLRSIIASVKRTYETAIQASDGRYVRYLKPDFYNYPLDAEGNTPGSHVICWICLTYFSLEQYSGLLGTDKPKCFPTPTLLQVSFPRTTRNRDMEQAVCQQKGAPPQLCWHVGQLWCLVLDNCTNHGP